MCQTNWTAIKCNSERMMSDSGSVIAISHCTLSRRAATTGNSATDLLLIYCQAARARHQARMRIDGGTYGTKFNVVFVVSNICFNPSGNVSNRQMCSI